MTAKIIKTVSQVLNTEVNVNTSQKNCDLWDSLMHIHLMIALEEAFDISFEPEDIARMTDIGSIEQAIKRLNPSIPIG